MKRIYLIIALLALPMEAAPRPLLDQNQKARQAALDLIRQGKLDEGVTYLQANSPGQSGAADARALDLAQSLLDITFRLYNERRLQAARIVGLRALVIAGPKAEGPKADASLQYCFGVFFEEVCFDVDRAKGFYEGALAAQPANLLVRGRLVGVQRKQQVLANHQPSGRP